MSVGESNTVGSPAEWKIIVQGITSREPVVGIEHEPNLFSWWVYFMTERVYRYR